MRSPRQWFLEEQGSTAIEYGLLVTVFAFACLVGYMSLSTSVVELFGGVATAMPAPAAP